MNTQRPPRASHASLVLSTLLVLLMGVGVVAHVDRRFQETEPELAELHRLRRSLGTVRGEIESIRAGLEEAALRSEYTAQLEQRLRSTESRLGSIGQAVEAQASNLESWEDLQKMEIEAELEARDRRLEQQWEALSELASSARDLADESRRQVEELDETLRSRRDLPTMWRELVGPVVQLYGDSSVGSGVLLEARWNEEEQVHEAYLITAWHVVRDIQGDLSRQDQPVPLTIYSADGSIDHHEAHLLCFDAELDAALLTVKSKDELKHGATLATREELESIRIFDEIYAVGCPLGNDPIPTRGEISTLRHEIDGKNYWMINAPTYIGNSGGGIFNSETRHLLAIFSKIYTHGSLRPTIVPHMGLAVSLEPIYDWLESEGYSDVFEG